MLPSLQRQPCLGSEQSQNTFIVSTSPTDDSAISYRYIDSRSFGRGVANGDHFHFRETDPQVPIMQHSQYGIRMHDQENIDGLGAACNGQAGQRRCVLVGLLNRRPRPIVA